MSAPALPADTALPSLIDRAAGRLADEYDAAQGPKESGNKRFKGNQWSVPDDNGPPAAAELGLSRKEIHEARRLRDVEAAEPGIVERTAHALADQGREPTRAAVRRAVAAPAKACLPHCLPLAK